MTIARLLIWIVAAILAPVLALAAALLLARPAAAETLFWDEGPDRSWITLGPTDAPGAAAQVAFRNENIHTGNAADTLHWNGLAVTFELQLNKGGMAGLGEPDLLIVTAPDGYFADPPEVLVPEAADQVVLIYPLNGVGF